nr:MAG TPA: hypothetical protein [Caudoviricetes sp.]
MCRHLLQIPKAPSSTSMMPEPSMCIGIRAAASDADEWELVE